MALFYLVRHGESVWNAEERLCGRTDIDLNDEGRRQAALLGERLRLLPPTAIYMSPLKRTVETAEIIARGTGLAPVVDPRIVELNYGEWEGKTFAEVQAQDGELYRRWDADPAAEAPPGGETGLAGVVRIAAFLDEMKQRHSAGHEHVVVVTHKTVCRLAICHALGLNPAEYRRRLSMSNTALNILAPEQDGWRVVLVNDTSHLERVHSEAATPNGTF
jgi:broad specificity phosphatase PhoE